MAEIDIPNRFEQRHRPEEPSAIGVVVQTIVYPIIGQAFVLSICFFVWVYSSVSHAGRTDFETVKNAWSWMTGVSVILSFVVSVGEFSSAYARSKDYETDYLAWKAKQDLERAEVRRALDDEAERERRARFQQAHQRQVEIRRQRLAEIEAVVLHAQAQHIVDADFWGSEDPASLLASFRSQLSRLAISDLGLLRESQNPAVRKIIGNGNSLPPTPPLNVPLSAFYDPR